jgi:hypothetical protein
VCACSHDGDPLFACLHACADVDELSGGIVLLDEGSRHHLPALPLPGELVKEALSFVIPSLSPSLSILPLPFPLPLLTPTP